MRRLWLACWAILALALVSPVSLVPAQTPTDQSPDQAALEKKFADDLSESVFVGFFTDTNKDMKDLKEERYTISKVSKVQGDTWLFQVRIQYGGKDATLPLPLNVKWAGDTPVITLTKAPVPGFGTFTARVVVYDDHYAGYWSGADHGGHLLGRIEKAKK
ncbi:MAG: hypothetical protein JNM18_03860 [Planctomycetaceae bacterium]|nr:hypothetical protein [Planctomycetaceae bacterium]